MEKLSVKKNWIWASRTFFSMGIISLFLGYTILFIAGMFIMIYCSFRSDIIK